MAEHSRQKAYESIRSWLSARSGIHYGDEKRELLLQRLSRVQRAFSYNDLDQLAHNLLVDPVSEVELAVISAASTNHTYFFREIEILTNFRNNILPLLRDRREIRIWSAACSSGEEAYTIAMLIAEALGEEALRRTTILGTDISAPVIERAELGIVSDRQVSKVPDDLRVKYFKPVGFDQYQIADVIRRPCTFRRMNLQATPYPFQNQFQVVFARNVLYYFDVRSQADTLLAIHAVTEPGGWLITSVTESIRDLGTPWVSEMNGVHRKAMQ